MRQFLCRFDAKQTDSAVRCPIEESDQTTKDDSVHADEWTEEIHRFFWSRECQTFRHQLSHHHLNNGCNENRKSEGNSRHRSRSKDRFKERMQ